MAQLQAVLVLLVTALLRVEAANIPDLEGNPIGDIISTLNTFKTSIINMIISGFKAPKNPSPPVPQESYHHIVLPPPPPHIPHDLYQADFVRNPPEQYQHPPHHLSTYKPSTTPQSFPIIDINIPAEVPHVERPEEAQQIPTVDLINSSEAKLEISTLISADTEIVSDAVGVDSLSAGPHSFVDSERVNAGIEISEIDEKTIKNIPEDLWREDIVGIKKRKKVKKVRHLKKAKNVENILETSTPSDPQLVIE